MQDAATFAPKDAKVQYYLAQCALQQGHTEVARKAYQQAVKLDAKVADPIFKTELDRAWADHLQRRGRSAEAIQVYEDLLRRAEAREAFLTPEEQAELHAQLARAYARQGKAAQAAEHQRKAAQYRERGVQQRRLRGKQGLWVTWMLGGFLAAGLQFFFLFGLWLIVCIIAGVLRSRSGEEVRWVPWTFKEVMKVYGEFFVWPVVGLLLYALALSLSKGPSMDQLTAPAGWVGLAVLLAGLVLFMLTLRRRFADKFAHLYPEVSPHSLDFAVAARSLLGWELLATMLVHLVVGTVALTLVMEMLA